MRHEAHEILNALPPSAAEDALERCCGSKRWIEGMLRERPFASTQAMLDAADRIWSGLAPSDYLEAFEHHPEIGEDPGALKRKFGSTADWAAAEQSGAAAAEVDTLRALRDSNREYLARFGFIFIVCATGKSAEQMLAMMRERLVNTPEVELRIAATEQAKITKLRLAKAKLSI